MLAVLVIVMHVGAVMQRGSPRETHARFRRMPPPRTLLGSHSPRLCAAEPGDGRDWELGQSCDRVGQEQRTGLPRLVFPSSTFPDLYQWICTWGRGYRDPFSIKISRGERRNPLAIVATGSWDKEVIVWAKNQRPGLYLPSRLYRLQGGGPNLYHEGCRGHFSSDMGGEESLGN